MVLSFERVNTVHYDQNRLPDPRRFDPDCYKDGLQSLFEAASDPMLPNETPSLQCESKNIRCYVCTQKSQYLGIWQKYLVI